MVVSVVCVVVVVTDPAVVAETMLADWPPDRPRSSFQWWPHSEHWQKVRGPTVASRDGSWYDVRLLDPHRPHSARRRYWLWGHSGNTQNNKNKSHTFTQTHPEKGQGLTP